MRDKIKILYFTRTDLGVPNNGGAIVCRNHIRRMAQDPRLDVTLCNAAAASNTHNTEAFAASIGVPLHFVPTLLPVVPRFRPAWPFFFEVDALNNPQVDKAVLEVVNRINPDVIAIDYLFSALFVPSLFSLPVRRVTITLNRESEFYRNLQRLRRTPPNPSEQRLSEFESAVYRSSTAVVALTASDIPPIASEHGRVIPPLLDSASERWSPANNSRVFFVGNAHHHPNLQAIEWIATKLAPILEAKNSEVRFQIVGADTDKVPPAWRRSNVEYLGLGDQELVTNGLVGSGLFIAPIANNFGSKIKILDCLSHGTPIVATDEALSGVSFLRDVPRIQLDQPQQAAEMITSLLEDKTTLASLSNSVAHQLADALKEQEGIWSRLFEEVLMRELPRAERFEFLPRPVEMSVPENKGPGRIGRNDPCPCGSAKKFKHCHGQLV